MRLLVISDSHKNTYVLDRIIRTEPTAKHIFFLGDVVDDIEDMIAEYPDRTFHIVTGNCDRMCSYPRFDIVSVGGIDVFMTHGHIYGVNYGTDTLREAAKNVGAKIALYGHTHISNIEYKDGIYAVNPGSPTEPRSGGPSYAVIDILENGILPTIKTL